MAKKKSLENAVENIPTEQEKSAKRKKMHKDRPNLGAVNDKRKKSAKNDYDPSDEEINARLEQVDTGLINISYLSDKFGLDPKKVRATIRGLGYNAPPVKEPNPNNFGPRTKYEFEPNSKEHLEIESALKKLSK